MPQYKVTITLPPMKINADAANFDELYDFLEEGYFGEEVDEAMRKAWEQVMEEPQKHVIVEEEWR